MMHDGDDAAHDAALAARIALLSATDMGLAHLGVDAGASAREVESLVVACGESACSSRLDMERGR
jgi:hypothetical protein